MKGERPSVRHKSLVPGWGRGDPAGEGWGRKPLQEETCPVHFCYRVKFPNEVASAAGSLPGPVSAPGSLLGP